MPKSTKRTTSTKASTALIRSDEIERQILVFRGQKVLLDSHLAAAYGTDFMFQLTRQEFDNLRSQSVTSSSWGGRRRPPYAFTEHGAVMLASVLSSPAAVEASIQVVRVFVRLRQLIQSNDKLRRKLARIETKLHDHDEKFAAVFDVIRELMDDEDDGESVPPIGYETERKRGSKP